MSEHYERQIADLTAEVRQQEKRAEKYRAALEEIIEIKEEPYAFPADWHQQVKACAECKRWQGHPIQLGICDTHRRPLWDREKHDRNETARLGLRMRDIAREALKEEM